MPAYVCETRSGQQVLASELQVTGSDLIHLVDGGVLGKLRRHADEAAALGLPVYVDRGATFGEAVVTIGPPTIVDTPAVTVAGKVAASAQVGDTLSVTTGNWDGEPGGYRFAWRRDAVGIGTDADTYVVVAADAGHALSCVVSAVNALGETAAPPSNSVAVAGATRARDERRVPRR